MAGTHKKVVKTPTPEIKKDIHVDVLLGNAEKNWIS
jgi:hypothetical protein